MNSVTAGLLSSAITLDEASSAIATAPERVFGRSKVVACANYAALLYLQQRYEECHRFLLPRVFEVPADHDSFSAASPDDVTATVTIIVLFLELCVIVRQPHLGLELAAQSASLVTKSPQSAGDVQARRIVQLLGCWCARLRLEAPGPVAGNRVRAALADLSGDPVGPAVAANRCLTRAVVHYRAGNHQQAQDELIAAAAAFNDFSRADVTDGRNPPRVPELARSINVIVTANLGIAALTRPAARPDLAAALLARAASVAGPSPLLSLRNSGLLAFALGIALMRSGQPHKAWAMFRSAPSPTVSGLVAPAMMQLRFGEAALHVAVGAQPLLRTPTEAAANRAARGVCPVFPSDADFKADCPPLTVALTYLDAALGTLLSENDPAWIDAAVLATAARLYAGRPRAVLQLARAALPRVEREHPTKAFLLRFYAAHSLSELGCPGFAAVLLAAAAAPALPDALPVRLGLAAAPVTPVPCAHLARWGAFAAVYPAPEVLRAVQAVPEFSSLVAQSFEAV
jgi:hypothetical protein